MFYFSKLTNFIKENRNKHELYLELGVGENILVIIKYSFR